MTPRQLAELFRRLEETGAHNLNLVTPSHFRSGDFRGAVHPEAGRPGGVEFQRL